MNHDATARAIAELLDIGTLTFSKFSDGSGFKVILELPNGCRYMGTVGTCPIFGMDGDQIAPRIAELLQHLVTTRDEALEDRTRD